MTPSRIPTALSVALLGALLLSACNPPGTVTPPLSGGEQWPEALTLPPYSVNAQTTQPGPWKVSSKPSWLNAAVFQGAGSSVLKLNVPDPVAAVPAQATSRTVSGNVTLSGPQTATIRVNLNLSAVSGGGFTPSPVSAGAGPGGAGRVIVQYREGAAGLSQQSLAAQGLRLQSLSGRAVTFQTQDVQATLDALRQDPDVQFAAPDGTLHALQTAQGSFDPGDELAYTQWEMHKQDMGAVLADRTEKYPNAVTVAVLDTGVKAAHPDLQGRIYSGVDGAMDFVSHAANGDGDGVDRDADDTHNGASRNGGSHGTHVTGTIVARRQGPGAGTGIVGNALGAPVTVLPVRVLGQDLEGSISDVLNGLRYAAGLKVTVSGQTYTNPHPARVINLSLGGAGDSLTTEQVGVICAAVKDVSGAGALVVSASGNSGTRTPYYPASCPGAVSVASVTLDAQKNWVHASYSNSNDLVTLSAPGGSNLSPEPTTYNGGTYAGKPLADTIMSTEWDYVMDKPVWAQRSGTSMATPAVSALAALMLSKGVTKAATDTRAALIATATDVDTPGVDVRTGAGVINPVRALQITGTSTPTPTPAGALLVTLTERSGKVFFPAIQGEGWVAYLAPGTYTVRTGHDKNADGQLQSGEVEAQGPVTVTPGKDEVFTGKS